LKSSLHDRI